MHDLALFQRSIGFSFSNNALLREALTHRSYLNERPDWDVPNNERLEFLGDAVLELAVTEELFHRFPDQQEGILTSYRAALVNYQILAKIAGEIQLEAFIFLSRGEAKDTGKAREVILANAFEALVGGLYLDRGYAEVKKFILTRVMVHLAEIIAEGSFKDAKSLLQEKAQSVFKLTPKYKVLRETGPDHDRIFTMGVYFGEKLIAEGFGPSKQDAELEAAKRALEGMN